MSTFTAEAVAAARPQPVALPLRELAPYAVFAGVMLMVLLYFVGADQSTTIHEFVHDGRHLLGFPCH
jgi:cobalt transporter subunit CbtB